MSSDAPILEPPTMEERPTLVRYGVLLFLCTLAMLLYVDRVCIGQAAKSIQKDLNLSDSQWAFVLNAFVLAYSIFEVPTGHWGDRYGSRGVITRIVIWWSIFTALTGAAGGLLSLMTVRFLFGVGEAGAFPNVALVLTKWFPPHHRGRVRGLVTMVSLLGAAAAPSVSAYLIDSPSIGWRKMFAVFGAVGVVWATIFYWWFRDRPSEHASCNDAERKLINPTNGHASAPAHHDHEPIPWGIVLTSPNMWLLGTIMMVSASLFYLQFQWIPNYLKEVHGQSQMASGWLGSVIMFGGAAGCLLGGALADAVMKRTAERKWSRRLCGGIALFMSAVSVIGVRMAESPTVCALCNASALMFIQMSVPTWWTVVSEISGRHGASMWGLMNSMGGLCVMATTFLIGWFVQQRKDLGYASLDVWNPIFVAMGCLLLVGATLWLFIDPTRSIVERPKANA